MLKLFRNSYDSVRYNLTGFLSFFVAIAFGYFQYNHAMDAFLVYSLGSYGIHIALNRDKDGKSKTS